MLVCHCKAVNDAAVRAVIAAGARDEFDVAEACGAGSQCGGCVPAVTALLRTHVGMADGDSTAGPMRDCAMTSAPGRR